ncbi:MAG: S9 family peptidase [Alphaproteobacteria bacterium]|nr:S9 family peptidase [Alphaproteobacteria bacterium]
MFKRLTACLAAFAAVGLSAAASAQDTPAHHYFAQMETTWDAAISPDGSHVALGCSPSGLREVCIYDLSGQAQMRRVSPPAGSRFYGMRWASANHLLISLSSLQTINSINGIYEVDYTRLLSFDIRDNQSALMMRQFGGSLSTLSNISSLLINDDDNIAMQITLATNTDDDRTGSRIGGSQDFQTIVFEVDLNDGEYGDRIVNSARLSVLDFVLNADGEVIARVLYDNESNAYSIRAGRRGNDDLYAANHPIDLPYIFGPIDDSSALAIFMPDGVGLQRLDLETGEFSAFDFPVNRAGAVLDPSTGELVGFEGVSRSNQLPVTRFDIDEELQTLQNQLANALPESAVNLVSWTPDRNTLIVEARDQGRPATFYLFERDSMALSVLATEQDFVQQFELPEVRTLSYPARDGLDIPAILYTPPASRRAEGPLPLILMPHGGPRARDTASYNWQAAALAYEGYAVLQPNFRGSVGFGGSFEAAGYGEFGGAMIRDIADGARYLAAQGITREDYCVFGGSYGGYAALMLALDDADAAQCAIAFAPVTDPLSMLSRYRNNDDNANDIIEYWERYMGSRFQSDEDIYAQSPRRRAATLERPVLLVHGADDLTVPIDQSNWFVENAQSTGLVSFVPMAGEDHYLGSVTVRVRLMDETINFLRQHYPAN